MGRRKYTPPEPEHEEPVEQEPEVEPVEETHVEEIPQAPVVKRKVYQPGEGSEC